jgi:hypothetical protein
MRLVKKIENGRLKQLSRKEERKKIDIVKSKEKALWRSLVRPA